MIRIVILGSTGSIGVSTLNVVERHPDRFEVVGLAANRSVDRLAEQVARHPTARVVVADGAALEAGAAPGADDWATGRRALVDMARLPEADVVVNALVGSAGLEPSLAALHAGKRLALANKESLVAGGGLLKRALRTPGARLVPIDSEHSAILQCMAACRAEEVRRIVLTASGGPFRGFSTERLEGVGVTDALSHPTWEMGEKISVDSATLANKALEVIEAHLLYDIPYERIEVVVHPQSIVHSFVETVDGSVMAQLGFPTMELPILYALTHPDRLPDAALRTFDPLAASPLTFEPVDETAFPLFRLGVDAGRAGGTAPIVFNAANEVAVAAFLEGEVSFPGMARVVSGTLERAAVVPVTDLDVVFDADRTARRSASELVERHSTSVGSSG